MMNTKRRGARTRSSQYTARMNSPIVRRASSIAAYPVVMALLSVLPPSLVVAQAPPPPWRGTVEANGTLLYGAASQRVFTASTGVSHASPRTQWRLDLQGGYGDAVDQDTRIRKVIVRNARVSTSVDFEPRAVVSPFSFGSGESSLQHRISSRFAAGAGAKWTIWRPDSVIGGFVEDLSLSGALLAEETRALVTAPSPDDARGAGTRYRWSVRTRYRRRLSSALRLSHVSFYQPTLNQPGRYTLEATTTLAMPVFARAEFIFTHLERIDSEAKERGASSIRDGQLLFGVRTRF